jgi:adenosylhomocysteinase
MNSIIDDSTLALEGKKRVAWYREKMPVLRKLNKKFLEKQSFKDKVIAICMHTEPKTAYWIEGLLDGGAKHIYLVCCIGTTNPDTAAYLASLDKVTVYGKRNDTLEDHEKYLDIVLSNKIDLFLDTGASLIIAHHKANTDWQPLGANEETRSGKLLIEKEDIKTSYPLIVIDDSPVKQLLENEIGVGQSVVDGFMRATSLLVGGKNILVIGYGNCGKGVAAKFKALGANTMVYDKDPLRLLKAKVDGFIVGEMEDLIPEADVVLTVTGRFDIITEKHIRLFKEGCILTNSGHYAFEINARGIKEASKTIEIVRAGIEKISFEDKHIFLIQNANPINLASGEGNPIEIMDIGLGLQSASGERIIKRGAELVPGFQPVPKDIDDYICRTMLKELSE